MFLVCLYLLLISSPATATASSTPTHHATFLVSRHAQHQHPPPHHTQQQQHHQHQRRRTLELELHEQPSAAVGLGPVEDDLSVKTTSSPSGGPTPVCTFFVRGEDFFDTAMAMPAIGRARELNCRVLPHEDSIINNTPIQSGNDNNNYYTGSNANPFVLAPFVLDRDDLPNAIWIFGHGSPGASDGPEVCAALAWLPKQWAGEIFFAHCYAGADLNGVSLLSYVAACLYSPIRLHGARGASLSVLKQDSAGRIVGVVADRCFREDDYALNQIDSACTRQVRLLRNNKCTLSEALDALTTDIEQLVRSGEISVPLLLLSDTSSEGVGGASSSSLSCTSRNLADAFLKTSWGNDNGPLVIQNNNFIRVLANCGLFYPEDETYLHLQSRGLAQAQSLEEVAAYVTVLPLYDHLDLLPPSTRLLYLQTAINSLERLQLSLELLASVLETLDQDHNDMYVVRSLQPRESAAVIARVRAWLVRFVRVSQKTSGPSRSLSGGSGGEVFTPPLLFHEEAPLVTKKKAKEDVPFVEDDSERDKEEEITNSARPETAALKKKKQKKTKKQQESVEKPHEPQGEEEVEEEDVLRVDKRATRRLFSIAYGFTLTFHPAIGESLTNRLLAICDGDGSTDLHGNSMPLLLSSVGDVSVVERICDARTVGLSDDKLKDVFVNSVMEILDTEVDNSIERNLAVVHELAAQFIMRVRSPISFDQLDQYFPDF